MRRWEWAAAIGVYFALNLAAPFLRAPLEHVFTASVVATLAFLAVQLGLVAALSRFGKDAPAGLGLLLTGILMLVGLRLMAEVGWIASDPRSKAPMFPIPSALTNLSMTLAAVGLGRLVSLIIREPGLLAPVVPLAALIDVLTVYAPGGFVKKAIENNPQLTATLTVKAPQVATEQDFGTVTAFALIGVADLVFLSLFVVCLYKFGLKARLTLSLMFVALILYMAAVLLGTPLRLPALVPMAVVLLAVNWRQLRLTRQEAWMSVVVCAACAGLIAFLFWR